MTATKVLSTPADYAQGVLDGIDRLRRDTGIAADAIAGVVHASHGRVERGLERRGARVALVTTEGFRDVLEFRRLRIPVLYDLQYEKPEPLVPRALRFEVRERLGPRGEVWRELDEASVTEAAASSCAHDVQAVAISLLHSYADGARAPRRRARARGVGADVFVTARPTSSPRCGSTSARAPRSSMPTSGRRSGATSARSRGVCATRGSRRRSRSCSRAAAPPTARGAQAGAHGRVRPGRRRHRVRRLGRLIDRPDLISLDMGGTTAKAALLEDGLPARRASTRSAPAST